MNANAKCIALIAATAALIPATAQARWPTDRQACQEDAPCWNWATMGNHKRGVIVANSFDVLVSPCRYQRFMKLGLIDRKATPRLKGDKLAMRLRCK